MELWKADNTLMGSYTYDVDPHKVTIPGINEAHGIVCITMNGFTRYGDGPVSTCALEEEKGKCERACVLIRSYEW